MASKNIVKTVARKRKYVNQLILNKNCFCEKTTRIKMEPKLWRLNSLIYNTCLN